MSLVVSAPQIVKKITVSVEKIKLSVQIYVSVSQDVVITKYN